MSCSGEVPSLRVLCIRQLIQILEANKFSSRLINELCKYVPDHLLDPVLDAILAKRALTDVALAAFLVPSRVNVCLPGCYNIKNSTLKLIGLNCPYLVSLDLSDCSQVTNAVVRSVLQGCPSISEMSLARCLRVTDSAFDPTQSPFSSLIGCLSLRSINLQGCPQVTGELAYTLNKLCSKLKYLNLSQCKQITAPAIQQIFNHNRLRILNLAFLESVCDEIFLNIQVPGIVMNSFSPLQILDLGKSRITDISLSKMSFLGMLEEIRLHWCHGVTDIGINELTTHCPLLKVIDLKSCFITDQSIGYIANRCSHLRVLDLSWCNQLTDQSIDALTRSGLLFLEHLLLVWCSRITPHGLQLLRSLPSLKRLDISGCSDVTDECTSALRAHGIALF